MDRTLLQILKELIRLNIKPNFKKLAKQYNCDWRTAKKQYLEQLDIEKGLVIKQKKRESILDPYKHIIDEKLKLPGITAYGIYDFLRKEKGYKGKYGIVRDYIRQKRKEIPKKATIRVNPDIGKSGQVDWKEDFKLVNKYGELFILNIFLFRLHYSKKFKAIITIDKKRDEVLNCLINCFETFGGIPRDIWFDNMSTIIDICKVNNKTSKKVNIEIEQFAKDMNFTVIPCKARRAQTKGTVENLAKLTNRLIAYNNEFETFQDLIDIVNKFNIECGKEKSQAHGRIVDDVFKEEKEYLQPLPNESILNQYKTLIDYRKVHSDSMICFKSCRYSVPTKFINTYVAIRLINNQLHIYDNTDLIRCHEINNNSLNYNKYDKIEILKSDLLYGKSDEEITNIINESDLSIYDDLKEGVSLK